MSSLSSCISHIKHTLAYEFATLQVQVYNKKIETKLKGEKIKILGKFQNTISGYIFTGNDSSSTLRYALL